MAQTWTAEQILALAPDAGSAKDGEGLASPRKWVALGHSAEVAWGLCQGSAKLPYQVIIDLSEPAFRCTCPSRKFPCKHGLGLFLLLAASPASLTDTTPPDWVDEWLAKRAKSAQQKAEREAGGSGPVDEQAQARRAAGRAAKVAAGLDDLDRWLRDLVRGGLAAAQTQPPAYWETPAKRLVDALAPGAAQLLRDLASIPATGEGWPARLLEGVGRLHLAVAGYRRRDTLPPAQVADLRTVLGWTLKEDDLLSEVGVRDQWLVLGQVVEADEKLREQRIWLWGQTTGRAALVLNFAFAGQALELTLLPDTVVEATLVYYPGAYPQRAIIKTRHGDPALPTGLPGYASIATATSAYAAALAAFPWIRHFPLPLQAGVPVRYGRGWALRDAAGHLLPLAPCFDDGWRLLALSNYLKKPTATSV